MITVEELIGRLPAERRADLKHFADTFGSVWLDGEIVPLTRPRAEHGVPHHMDFDRRVCAAGVKRFVRPLLPSDEEARPPGVPGFDSDWILVAECEPGVRERRGVSVTRVDK